jgi:hypothetical protein
MTTGAWALACAKMVAVPGLLFLGNSNDLNPDIPDELRSPAVTARLLADAIGEPVDLSVRVIWPDPSLPDLVESWLDRYEPDIVFLKVNWYWWGYESVPRRIERVLGPAGRLPSRAGTKLADTSAVGHSRAFKQLRRLCHRAIGGDAPFTAAQVVDVVDACMARILARESIVLVVKGTATYTLQGEPAVWDYRERFERGRDRVEGALESKCRRLGVAWSDNRGTGGREHGGLDRGDGIHHDVDVQEFMARRHAGDLAAAWIAAHGGG